MEKRRKRAQGSLEYMLILVGSIAIATIIVVLVVRAIPTAKGSMECAPQLTYSGCVSAGCLPTTREGETAEPETFFVCRQPAGQPCSDGIDNDGDGLADADDPGCTSNEDATETLLEGETQGMELAELESKFETAFDNRLPTGEIDREIYYFGREVYPLIAMYEVTQEHEYIETALQNVERKLGEMGDWEGDGHLEWLEPAWDVDGDGTGDRAYCLSTQRGTRALARLARVIKNDPELDALFGARAEAVIQSVKHNIVNDSQSGCSRRFEPGFNTVHHIVSHPTQILLDLYLAEGDIEFREGEEHTYIATLEAHATAMKNSLFPQPSEPNAVEWGSTDCTSLAHAYPDCYYTNVPWNNQHPLWPNQPDCTDGQGNDYCSPSDTSHAEDFVFTATELYRAGIVFEESDIEKLVYTFKNAVWNKDIENPKFHDFVDGKLEPEEGKYGQWVMGSNIAPGWTALGGFSKEIQRILETSDSASGTNTAWRHEMSFYAELARNKVAGNCRYSNRAREVSDGIDNDCDGRTDENQEPETPVPACSDGIDNDNDGYIDLADTGCQGSEDNSEEDAAGCRLNFQPINGNLVQNPFVECDNDEDGIPDDWEKSAESAGHSLSWVEDPESSGNSRVLVTEYSGIGSPNSFGWKQEIDVEPNTWYEFSVSFATNGIEPNIGPANQQIEPSTLWAGVYAIVRNSGSESISNAGPFVRVYGPNLTGWDSDAWLYRTYETKGFSGWRNVTKYFKTPGNADYVLLKTYNYPKGKVYADNFVLRPAPGNTSPDAVPFKREGTLGFVQHKGNSFFPIVYWGFPERNGVDISLDEMKAAGFNTVGKGYRGMDAADYKQLLLEKNLAVEISLANIFWKRSGSPHESSKYWVNDPLGEVDYGGAEAARKTIDEWHGFENLLMFLGPDEIDCGAHRKGAFIPKLGTMEAIRDYVKGRNPDALIYYNFCGRAAPYTHIEADKVEYYFPYTDIVSYTNNMALAYPKPDAVQLQDKKGELARWSVASSQEAGDHKPLLAFGIGVYWWSNWDGLEGGERWHFSKYLPFNLQRYQVYTQIINGATGALFYGGSNINLDNSYYNHQWQQVKAISQELTELEPVLLEPRFYDEWQVSDERVEVMMKKHAGKAYLFTALNHYEDVEDVTITLSGYSITRVTALNEVLDGDIGNVFDREIPVNAGGESFTDDFTGDYPDEESPVKPASPLGSDTPGYAVHVYEIEYS